MQSADVTLKMRSRSPKSRHFFSPIPVMRLCQFGQNPPIGSEDRVQTRSYAEAHAHRIHPKSSMSPLLFGCGDIALVAMTSLMEKKNAEAYGPQWLS